jgi:hypothetical protein
VSFPYRLPPFQHQLVGTAKLVEWDDPSSGRIYGGCFGILDEMGLGKTKQVIDAQQILFTLGEIERVIIVVPGSVLGVWYNSTYGELAKHLWKGLNSNVILYHSKVSSWEWSPNKTVFNTALPRRLEWIITNYEFIRRGGDNLKTLLKQCDSKTSLVIDESAAIKNWTSMQTKAVRELRKKCRRVTELNGTYVAHSPKDVFAQANVLHMGILDCAYISHYMARYAVMGGFMATTRGGHKVPTQVLRWVNMGDLQERLKPYVLRRMKRDCIDLPAVLPAVTVPVTLKPKTWEHYKKMRDEMVVYLGSSVGMTQQAMIKVMRLSQITSGFLGGVQSLGDILDTDDRPDWMPKFDGMEDDEPVFLDNGVVEVGDEKQTAAIARFADLFEEDPDLKILVWCRFVPELKRLMKTLGEKFPKAKLGAVCGQSIFGSPVKVEREAAMRLLDPASAPEGPVIVGGTYGTGSLGLNFTACHNVHNLSFDATYWKYVQSAARVDRPGQTHEISTTDYVAVGPQGQRTIDHAIVLAKQRNEDINTWTMSAWIEALTEE